MVRPADAQAEEDRIREAMAEAQDHPGPDISADLNDDDGSGYLWAFLDEARDPDLVKTGAVLVAGSENAAATCEVTRLEPADDGDTIVHLRVAEGKRGPTL